MWDRDQVQLGHSDDRKTYMGLEHRTCNWDAAIRKLGRKPPQRDELGIALPPKPRTWPPAQPTLAAGYGQEHRELRAMLLTALAADPGSQFCCRCEKPMFPWEQLDLGHNADRSGWTGLEHANCNRGRRQPGRKPKGRNKSEGRPW